MKHDSIRSGKRKPVNLSLDTGVVESARSLGINLSQTCEAALRDATTAERNRQWKEENREAMESWNRWLDQNGLPYAGLRLW
jgi:antitoxin CcdA